MSYQPATQHCPCLLQAYMFVHQKAVSSETHVCYIAASKIFPSVRNKELGNNLLNLFL